MGKERLTAFSDGVLAIIITIMVLEMKAPHAETLEALFKLWPVFVAYVLSFIYVAIYWNNHHHLLTAGKRVNGATLWANMHLLFWLSLVPFATAWMGENHFASLPVALYGVTMCLCAIAYYILVRTMLRLEGPDSFLARALGSDFKGKVSIVIYIVGIALAFVAPLAAAALYGLVALIWLIPDRRIEARIGAHRDESN